MRTASHFNCVGRSTGRPAVAVDTARILADLVQRYGEDSIFVKMAATMFGSTETTFYVIAVYFGAVGVRKTRHALPAGLIADMSSALLSVYIIRWMLS